MHGPLLEMDDDDDVTVRLTKRLTDYTCICFGPVSQYAEGF